MNAHLRANVVNAKEECGMRLRLAAPTILVSTLLVAIVAVACLETTNTVIQTTTAQQKEDNRQATREALIAQGLDPDSAEFAVGAGSLAEQVQQTAAAQRTATAEAGGGAGGEEAALVTLAGGEQVSAAQATKIAEFGTEDKPLVAPDGPAESGSIVVEIGASGKMIPAVIKITPGSTVKWEWTDRSRHSTQSLDDALAETWDSGGINRGLFDKENPIFEHTFNTAGRYTYGSRVNGDISDGTVFVVDE
jgi:plastocyanin